jgi:Chaperone of endosialidase
VLNTADNNTATGAGALLSNTTGLDNTANGAFALFGNTAGNFNTAVGNQALFNNTTGGVNTAIGNAALGNNTTGASNVALGDNAGGGITTANDVICIGTAVAGENVSGTCYMGNIFGETSASGAAVYVNSSHRLGTLTSSSRFKDDIKPMERVSEALFALKPVTFHYKKEIDPAGMQQFGLVAEEVEKVNPDLVVRDKEGKPYSVRYEQVNAMLLNEFLKEHRKNEEQGATIAGLKKEVASLAATVKVQATQIQRVSAQIEISKAIRQTALKNR